MGSVSGHFYPLEEPIDQFSARSAKYWESTPQINDFLREKACF